MNFATLAVLVFGAVLVALWSARELRFFQVTVAILLGFYLADSQLAPTITTAVQAVFGWVATWHI
jgi:hypothetical protein